MSMNIYANKGDNVVFTGEGGYDHDQQRGRLHLVIGSVYTIEQTIVHQSSTEVYIQEVPNVSFNSVMFIDFSDLIEFNPNEPWQVKIGDEWYNQGSEIYIGRNPVNGDHVTYDTDPETHPKQAYHYYSDIRNIIPTQFKEGQRVWGKPKDNNPSGIWLFGSFTETKDGSLVINHQNEQPVVCSRIEPLYIGGPEHPQFPPFP